MGWPKGWAVFRQAKEVWNEETDAATDRERYQNIIFFPIGEPNPYGQFFAGQSYLLTLYRDKEKAVGQENWLVGGHGRKNAANCVQCGACEEVCPQHISIREELVKSCEALDIRA